ncbi:MAG TPA: DinB family protein [Bryobacteraceae bacterium]|nr:DinB family protein [Bryobacteraceae bacterium]
MRYEFVAISPAEIPCAREAVFQHLIDTYASETNKVISTWRCFTDADLPYRPHPKSETVLGILRHQLLSERRFFAEFAAVPEPAPAVVLPDEQTVDAFCRRMRQLALRRLAFFAQQSQDWWLEDVAFFGEKRQRVWVFWRRVLHTCHHRTQLTVYLRLMDRPVPSVYGPTADVSWRGADPTNSVEAAGRK